MAKRKDQAIVEIARQLIKERPGRGAKNALKEALDIYNRRGSYKPVSDSELHRSLELNKAPTPEHIALTIKRQKEAEVRREKEGRSLPTARMLQGGRTSKR